MIEKLKDNRALIVRILLCAMTVLLVASTAVVQGFADKDEHEDDFSFYRVASAAATYYDQTHNDKKDNDKGIKKFEKDGNTLSDFANIGVAGDLMGFVDEDYSKGFFGATISKLSASSQARSYMSFRDNEKALMAYVQYGHALQMLGLDSTANTSLDISTIVRYIAGIFLILAYSLAVMVSLLFKAVLTLLQGLNPFAWFLGSTAVNVPFHSWFSNAAKHMPNALSGVQSLVSTVYSAMSAIGIVMIPVFFVIMVAGIILFRTGRGAMGDSVPTKIRKYVTRVVFILAGIPILGASYTACLDALLSGNDSDAFSVSTSAANDVIGSTLVDFEAWAINKRLALPGNAKITIAGADTVGGAIDTKNTDDLRQIARNINAMSNPKLTRPTSQVSAMNGVAIDVGNSSASSGEPNVLAAYDVMFRYMLGHFYKAADLETQYKSSMANKKISGGDYQGSFWSWFTGVDKDAPESLMDCIENDADVENYNDANKLAGNDSAGPYMNDNSPGGISVSNSGSSFTYTGNATKGLSTLAMYNYLTSEFDGSAVTTYSNNKVAALVMSHAHRSVSAIGGGAVRVLYVMYATVMLFVMAIIGFFYALAVLFGMFRRGVAVVTSTPFALMGNFRAMSKVTTIVAMMIIELIGTVFIYQVVIYVLTHILDIFMIPVFNVVNGGKSSTILSVMNTIGIPAASTDSFGGQAMQIGALSLAIIMLIVFAFKAMKLRKSFVKAMDEIAASMIDRLFSPGGAGAGGGAGGAGAAYANRPTLGQKVGSGAKKVAGVAGTGLAMAGANKLMGGGSIKGGLSKGDAALAAGSGEAPKPGGNGIEGGDKQGVPGQGGPGGPPQITGGGGSPDEKAGQKLIGGQSLDDNANKGTETDGGASMGEPGVVEGKRAELAAAESGQTVSEATEQGSDPMAKATGQVSAMEEENMADAANDLRKDAAKKTVSGTAKATVGAVQVAAGASSGNVKMAVDGAQNMDSGLRKARSGVSQGANAKQLAAQQTAGGKAAPTSTQNAQAMGASMAPSPPPRQSGYRQGGNLNSNASVQRERATARADVQRENAAARADAQRENAAARAEAQRERAAAKAQAQRERAVAKATRKTLSSKTPDGYI